MQIYDWHEIDDIQDLDMASLLLSEPTNHRINQKVRRLLRFPMF